MINIHLLQKKKEGKREVSLNLKNNPIQSHCVASFLNGPHLNKGKFFVVVNVNIDHSITFIHTQPKISS